MTYGQLFETQQHFEPLCAVRACLHPDRRQRLEAFLESYATRPEGASYHASTREFHDIVYELAANPVLALMAKAVTQILTLHIVSNMDPLDMHAAIHEEHQGLARSIIAGHAKRTRQLTEEHFRRQHEYYIRHAPSRVDDLVEWK